MYFRKYFGCMVDNPRIFGFMQVAQLIKRLCEHLQAVRVELAVQDQVPAITTLIKECDSGISFLNSLQGGAWDIIEKFFPWAKSALQSRYRPYRLEVLRCCTQLVDSLLGQYASLSTAERKVLISFCSKASVQLVVPRSRDTSSSIREIVAEYICRWVVTCNHILTLSSFGPKDLPLFRVLENLLTDEDFHVRMATVRGINTLPVASDFLPLIIRSLFRAIKEVDELIENGNPPYMARLHSESELLVEVIGSLVDKSPSVLDTVDAFDSMYQLVFCPTVSVSIRKSVARLVSKHVLGFDVVGRRFDPTEQSIEVLLAFMAQYTEIVEHGKLFACGMESFVLHADPKNAAECMQFAIRSEGNNHPLRKKFYQTLISVCGGMALSGPVSNELILQLIKCGQMQPLRTILEKNTQYMR
jgi:hypothetical protein